MQLLFKHHPFRLAAALALLAGTQVHAAWEPLGQEIANRTGHAWVLRFPTAGTGPTFGASINQGQGEGPVVPWDSTLTVPAHSVVRFHVDSAYAGQGDVAASFNLERGSHGRNSISVSLEVGRLPRLARFARSNRAEYSRSTKTELVIMAPKAITILDGGPLVEEIKEEKGPSGSAGDLAPLSEKDVRAGVDNPFHFYRVLRIRTDAAYNLPSSESPFAGLHLMGNLMPTELLADYFFNTLFAYNLRVFTGYDPGVNYDQIPTLAAPYFDKIVEGWLTSFCTPGGVKVVTPPGPGGDFREFIAWKDAFEGAQVALMRNRAFVFLGAAYMRQKIVTEKLATACLRQEKGHKDAAHAAALKRDRLTGEIQLVIYHWMQQAMREFVTRYQAASAADKPQVPAFLETWRPGFLASPRYAATLAAAHAHAEPEKEAEGIALPVK